MTLFVQPIDSNGILWLWQQKNGGILIVLRYGLRPPPEVLFPQEAFHHVLPFSSFSARALMLGATGKGCSVPKANASNCGMGRGRE